VIHLGLDFDNTTVVYGRVFHRHAVEMGYIPAQVEMHKRPIRDAIRRIEDGERKWTELQGLVYGKYMDEAEPAPGVEEFLGTCRGHGVRVSIISHKTLFPALGPPYNLREAARGWLLHREYAGRFGIAPGDIHFVGTLAEKLALVREKECTLFVDDLLEVLAHPDFPPGVDRLLYAPEGITEVPPGILPFSSWGEIRGHLFGRQ
jgi:hypothetical protein